MKKILIVITSFEMGGTLASLNSLLSVLEGKDLKVDIFAMLHKGDFYGRLPNCTILGENAWLSHDVFHRSALVKAFVKLKLVLRKLFEHVGIDLYALYNYIGGKQIHSDEYDAVIGYDETMARIICRYPAKKRINWIHCDYRRYAQGKDETKYYDRIDEVVCVSEFAKNVFTDIYPQYKDKVKTIHNVINLDLITQKAKESIDDKRFVTERYTIISCGRLDPVKQFSKIPKIAAKIKEQYQHPFRWYIIGSGIEAERQQIEAEIDSNGVTDEVVMLGLKSNPYPYLAKSDLYVCTSVSESFPMVVNEAKALCIPVVSNDFPSVKESLRDGIDGYVCTIDEMANTIVKASQTTWALDSSYYREHNARIVELVKALIC
jgi:glycosyltransferase involved in cell wall biosynthesis